MGLAAAAGMRAAGGRVSFEADEGFGDARDDFAVDELLLATGGFSKSGGGEPVDLAQRSLALLVQRGKRVVGEERALDAGRGEAVADVLGGVRHRRRREQEAVVDAGEQRAMRAPRALALRADFTECQQQARRRVPARLRRRVSGVVRSQASCWTV